VFGVPGSGASLTLIDALERNGVPFHPTHFEGAAAIMAGTVGRLTNRAGVAVSIKGPGLSNMVSGLAACHLEALPMVAIAEAYPPKSPITSFHKRLDHGGLVSAVTKGRRFISDTGPGFSELADWSLAEVPGPVLLDIAETAVPEQPAIPSPGAPRTGPVLDRVASAARPVVIAGTLAIRQGWAAALNNLPVPVFSTAAAKGVVDETRPQAAGVFTGAGLCRAAEQTILPEADLIIGLGLRGNEVLAPRKFHCDAINIDPLGKLSSDVFQFEAIGAADDASDIFSILDGKGWGLDALAHLNRGLRKHLLDQPFLPAHAFDAVSRRFGGRVRMVLDTGHFCTIGEHIWNAQRSDWFFGSGQGRYMGIGIPMAVAAALQDPDVPTAVVIGDGGIGPFFAELKIAAENKIPLLVILMSDGGFGSVRARAVKENLSQKFLVISEPSWLAAVEGLRISGVRATGQAALESALASWDPGAGPHYIELSFDPNAYQAMVEGIR
jgi:acetolactate synthase-1/2/3 large subunit